MACQVVLKKSFLILAYFVAAVFQTYNPLFRCQALNQSRSLGNYVFPSSNIKFHCAESGGIIKGIKLTKESTYKI